MRTPRRCFPRGSSKAAFCGVLQGRRGDASRWARLRRPSTGFCRAAEAMLPVGLVRGGFLRGFAGPPRRCFPLGSSKAAFCGLLQGRRDDACRWARLRRLSAGFCRAAEAMLADGLVQGGLLRDFAGPPRRCFPLGSSEAASHRIFQRRRCAQRRRSLLSFSPPPPGERMPRVRSRPCEPAGSPFPFPHFPTARSYFFLYPAVLPAIPRATFPASICPAGRQGQRHFLCRLHGRRSSALPFRPIGGAPGTVPLFLHPAARHRMPRATFPASFCPAGRQGQRRFLCRLHGRRSGALPFRPIGGAPGTAPLFLHPAARETDAARPFPPMRTGGQSLPFSTFSYRPAVLLSLPSRPASDAARHFSCILLSRRAAGTAPLSLPPAWAAERCAPFSPYRRRARHCTSFSTPRRPGNGCRARSPHPSRPPRQPLFPFPCFRATGAPMRTGGQSLLFPLFSAFSRAPESCFFLYPAARPTIPRTVATAMLPDGLV